MARTFGTLLVAIVIIGCQKQEQKMTKIDAALSAKQEIASTSIEVKTAKCESCVKNITKALENVDGVQKVSVDLGMKVATVEYVASRVTLASLETAIAKAGYNANGTPRDSVAYHGLDACCQ